MAGMNWLGWLPSRREARRRELVRQAQQWQRDAWEWSREHPGEAVMEAEITHDGSRVVWNGPSPWDHRVASPGTDASRGAGKRPGGRT